MGQALQTFTLRATLKTPVIMRGYLTLDALLMAELVTGDVSHLLKRDAQLYYASAAFLVDPLEEKQKASFVASMRPEHHPELRELTTCSEFLGLVGQDWDKAPKPSASID